MLQMKSGKITATTAEASAGKNVDCGFVPEFVFCFNENAADTEDAVLVRFGAMAAAQALVFKKMENDGGDDVSSVVNETTNGLSEYDTASLGAASSTLTGTSTPTGKAVAGTGGTLYLTELEVGDQIKIGDEIKRVTAITSNTALTVDSAFTGTAGDATTTRYAKGALVSATGFKGFTIPANFITAANDVIHFVAFGTQFEAA